MAEDRFSLWTDLIEELKERISDIGDLEDFTEEKCVHLLRRGINKLPNVQGLSNNVLVPFNFEPTNESGDVDVRLYENYSNVVTDYYLGPEDNSEEAYLETKAALIEGRQIALLKFQWSQEGTTGPPVLDFSLNKNPYQGERLVGSWLVDDGRVETIINGRSIDISAIPSPSFSFKWTFPVDSDYKVKDTTAEMFLVDVLRMRENKTAIVASSAAIIFTERAVGAGERGASKDYIETLYKHAETAWEEVRNSLGGGPAPTTGADAIDSGYNRTLYADRAFRKTPSLRDGQWVEITNRGVGGSRVIRVIH